jgi:hypothetical protein
LNIGFGFGDFLNGLLCVFDPDLIPCFLIGCTHGGSVLRGDDDGERLMVVTPYADGRGSRCQQDGDDFKVQH